MAKRKTGSPTKKRIKELFQSIEQDDVANLKSFLGEFPKQANIRGVGSAYFPDKTPLMYAIQCVNFPIARFLLENGANVNAKMSGDRRFSVLYMAIYLNTLADLDFVEELFNRGADPNVFDTTGRTPLHEVIDNACRYDLKHLDSIRLVKLFLKHGADPDSRRPSDRSTQGTARELAQHVSDRLPDEICNLLKIKKAVEPKSAPASSVETILTHPSGSHRTAYQALRDGIQMALDSDCSDWICITVNGKPDTGHGGTLWFKNRLLTFPFRFVTTELIDGCRNKFTPDLIVSGRKRRCQFVESATAGKIAAFVESIAKHHDKIKKECGDYGIEVYIDRDFEL